MEEYLVCIHCFSASSLTVLREMATRGELGTLHYAAKVVGPTYAEMQNTRLRNWIVANSWNGPRFDGFNMNPFVSKVELDDDIIDYYASESGVFTLEAAHQLWSNVEIAAACAEFDRWLRSGDAAHDTPTNRECDMLRRIAEESKIIAESAASHKTKSDFLLPKQTNSALQQQVVPDEISTVSLGASNPTRSSKSGVESLSKALSRHPYPYSDEERAQWVTAKEAAQIEKTVDAASLRKYRACARDGEPAEKTPDGLAGRDCDGRIWRKSGEHSHVIYLLASLRNFPKTSSKTSAKRAQKRG